MIDELAYLSDVGYRKVQETFKLIDEIKKVTEELANVT